MKRTNKIHRVPLLVRAMDFQEYLKHLVSDSQVIKYEIFFIIKSVILAYSNGLFRCYDQIFGGRK